MKNKKTGLIVGLILFSLILSASVISAKKPSKISEELVQSIETIGDDEVDVIAKYKSKPDQKKSDNLEKNHNAKVKHSYKKFDYIAFSIHPDELEGVAEDADLESIELDADIKIDLDQSREDILVDSAREIYDVSGEGVKVAVIDTGLAADHPAISHQAIQQVNYTTEPQEDLHGHGTHVACIIACEDETYRGVAPGVDLYIAKAINANGSGKVSDVLAGIDWAIENEVDIINISLSAYFSNCGDDILSQAANTAAEEGVLMAVSAGNRGPSASSVRSPGCSEQALTVGASINDSDIWSRSSRGPTPDGTIKPDVIAPGVKIMSAWKNGTFRNLSGTSMAAPHIAGLSALMLEKNPKLDNTEIKQIIKDTALDLGLNENIQGSGLAQAIDALDAAGGKKPKYGREYGECISNYAKTKQFDKFEECREQFKENKK